MNIDEFSSERTLFESERLGLLREVAAEEAHIAQIVAEIAALTASLEFHEELLQQKKRLAAPIRRIPPEVLGVIFEHCCESLDEGVDWMSRKYGESEAITQNSAPLLVSRVCRRWRRVALGTPQLWTFIDIGFHTFQSLNAPLVIRSFIEASAELTLAVVIRDDMDDEMCTKALESIESGLQRCGLLGILVYSWNELYGKKIFSDVGTMSRLKVLALPGSFTEELAGPMRSPNLESAFLYLENIAIMPISPHLSTLRVEFGTDNPMAQSELLQKLSHYPKLVGLRLDNAPWIEGSANGLCVALNFLQSLGLHSEEAIPTLEFLQALSLPSIRQLDLSTGQAYEDITDFLVRWPPLPQLQSLTIVSFLILDLIALSARLDNVVHLDVWGSVSITTAISSLSKIPGLQHFPRLRRFSVTWDYPNLPDRPLQNAMLSLVTSRGGFRDKLKLNHQLPHPLEWVKIDRRTFRNIDDLGSGL